MEKTSNLLDLKYQDLLWRIVGAVRRQARTIPAFRDSHNGCIRITVVPLTQEADIWLGGGTSDFGEFPEANIADVCEREFVYKIDPRGSHTIQYVCEDGHTEPVNCYGYSALKTAWVSWRLRNTSSITARLQNATPALTARSLPWNKSGATKASGRNSTLAGKLAGVYL